MTQMFSVPSARAGIETRITDGHTLKVVLLTDDYPYSDDHLLVTDVDPWEANAGGTTRFTLTGVSWDVGAAVPAVKADDAAVVGTGPTIQTAYVFDDTDDTLLFRVLFDAPITLSGELPIEWPGGRLATWDQAGGVEEIVAGDNVSVDNSDPARPIVSASLDGGGATEGYVDDAVATEAAARIAGDANSVATADAYTDAQLANHTTAIDPHEDRAYSDAELADHVADTDPHGDRAYAAALFAANDAMVFKGVIDCSTNPNYPAADAGHTYKVSVAGRIGGASGPKVEAGELLLCTVDGSAAGTAAAVGANWTIGQVNLDGAVTGPSSATDAHVVLFDGTSGRLIKDGGAATAFGLNVLATANAAALRTLAGLIIGTDVQAFHANLTAFAGLSLVADRLAYANGAGTLSLATFSSFARQILDDPDAATVRATIGAASVTGGGGETVATNATATGAVTVDPANGNKHNLTLTGNVTLTLTGPTSGKNCTITLRLTQDATGSRSVTWPASVKWPGGTPPTLSTAANAVDKVVLETDDGGTRWEGNLAGRAYS